MDTTTRTRKEPKERLTEVPAKGFEMFKDGKLNTRTPHNWNWATGSTNVPMSRTMQRQNNFPRLPLSTINGQRVIN